MLRYDLSQICLLCNDVFHMISDKNMFLHNVFGICDECAEHENVRTKLNAMIKAYEDDPNKKPPPWYKFLFNGYAGMERIAYNHVKEDRKNKERKRRKKEMREAFRDSF